MIKMFNKCKMKRFSAAVAKDFPNAKHVWGIFAMSSHLAVREWKILFSLQIKGAQF